jgi:hypothetical protein
VASEEKESRVSATLVKKISQLLVGAGQAKDKTQDEMDVLVETLLSSIDLGEILAAATDLSDAADLLLRDDTIQGLMAGNGMDVAAVISYASSIEEGDADAAASIVASIAMVMAATAGATVF